MIQFELNLQLFNDGAQSAGAEGVAGSNTEVGVGTQQVIYGKQEGTTEQVIEEMVHAGDEQPTEPEQPKEKTPEERKAEFEKLIKEEYKDLFAERTQQIIDKRFKNTKQLESQLGQLSPILDMVASRYGVQAGDIEGLQRALDNDNAYWEQAADEAGLTVEQYKHMKQLEREAEAFKQMKEQQQKEQFFNQQFAKWQQEAEQITEVYADFDFGAECENPKFMSLLKSGVPMQHAYEVLHMDDIKNKLMTNTAQVVENQVAQNIRAKGQRPPENGMSNKAGVVVKQDVSKLSRADRAEIAKRVARGETINW